MWIVIALVAIYFLFLRPSSSGGGGDVLGDLFGGGSTTGPQSNIPQGFSVGGDTISPTNVPTNGGAIPSPFMDAGGQKLPVPLRFYNGFDANPFSPLGRMPFYVNPMGPPPATALTVPTMPPPTNQTMPPAIFSGASLARLRTSGLAPQLNLNSSATTTAPPSTVVPFPGLSTPGPPVPRSPQDVSAFKSTVGSTRR